MSVDGALVRESRVRNRFATASIAGGFLLAGAAVFQLVGPHTKVDELTLDLIAANKRFPLDLIGAIVEALGWLGVAGALAFLANAARTRNPQMQPFIKWIGVIGPALAAVTGVGYAALIAGKAHDFVNSGPQTYQEASHLTSSGILLAVQLAGQLAALVVAVSFVLISLNAMRVGLLTRFMGYLGIFAGILVLFVITPIPVVQSYWLIAIGYLISGRWPTGLPPAWQSGRSEPWPSTQQVREQRAKRMGNRGGGRPPAPWRRAPAPAPAPAPAADVAASRGTRSTTSKRKRKQRRK
jgi:hypothetical protein